MLDGSLIKGLRDGYLGNITHIVLSDNPPDTNVDYQILVDSLIAHAPKLISIEWVKFKSAGYLYDLDGPPPALKNLSQITSLKNLIVDLQLLVGSTKILDIKDLHYLLLPDLCQLHFSSIPLPDLDEHIRVLPMEEEDEVIRLFTSLVSRLPIRPLSMTVECGVWNNVRNVRISKTTAQVLTHVADALFEMGTVLQIRRRAQGVGPFRSQAPELISHGFVSEEVELIEG
jgi:hypothetical protein